MRQRVLGFSKIYWGVFLVFLVFLGYSKNVLADNCDSYQCITCKYDLNTIIVTFNVSSKGNGTAKVESNYELKPGTRGITYNVTNMPSTYKSFESKSQNKLICPNNIYAKFENNGGLTTNVSLKFNVSGDKTYKAYKITEQSDNKKPFKSSGSSDKKTLSCDYDARDVVSRQSLNFKGHLVVSDTNEVEFTVDDSKYKTTIDDSVKEKGLFDNGCPSEIYIECGGSGVNYSCNVRHGANFVDNQKQDPGSSPTETPDADENNNQEPQGNVIGSFNPKTLCGDNNENCNLNITGFCVNPYAARTFKFIGLILMLGKILAVAIIIVLGIVDLVKIIISGQMSDVKKQGKNIVMRVVIGVVIFLLPTIIIGIYNGTQSIIGDEVIETTTDNDGNTLNVPTDFANCVYCVLDPTGKNCLVQK